MQFGLGSCIAQSLHAVGDVCYAEGSSAPDVQSIFFLDDKIEFVIVRPDGSRRHETYPLALFACRSRPRSPPPRPRREGHRTLAVAQPAFRRKGMMLRASVNL